MSCVVTSAHAFLPMSPSLKHAALLQDGTFVTQTLSNEHQVNQTGACSDLEPQVPSPQHALPHLGLLHHWRRDSHTERHGLHGNLPLVLDVLPPYHLHPTHLAWLDIRWHHVERPTEHVNLDGPLQREQKHLYASCSFVAALSWV